MKEFYSAIGGSTKETLEVLSYVDVFRTLERKLGLPRWGILFTLGKSNVSAIREYPGATKYALDNGAFRMLKADFDASLKISSDVARRWISKLESVAHEYPFAWVALPDVPVHGRKFVGRDERIRRIKMTAWLHEMAYDRIPNPRAVLQGYEFDEYMLSYELYSVKGIKSYDGVYSVGSVCVRKTSSLTRLASGRARGDYGTIKRLLDEWESKKISKGLHFFGLHGVFVREFKSHPMFYSSDSGAHGAILKFRWRDLTEQLGFGRPVPTKYVFAVVIQYVYSTRGFDARAVGVLQEVLGGLA